VLATERNRILTDRQTLAAEYIGAGKSYGVTAKKVGAAKKTIVEWTRWPEFQAIVKAKRQAALEEARSMIDASAPSCVRTLREVASGNIKAGSRAEARDRIRAATAILDRCPGLGPSSSVAVSATVASTVMELGTDDLLEAMRRTLLAEGATEAEAAAKVEALRARVAASP